LLGILQGLLARTGQPHAALEQLERILQRQVALLHALHQLLQFGEGVLEADGFFDHGENFIGKLALCHSCCNLAKVRASGRCLPDMPKVIGQAVLAHSGRASASTWSRNFVGKSPGVNTSTDTPSNSSSSACRPPRSNGTRQRIHQQIEIAAVMVGAMRHGTEDAGIRGAETACRLAHGGPVSLQGYGGFHRTGQIFGLSGKTWR